MESGIDLTEGSEKTGFEEKDEGSTGASDESDNEDSTGDAS